MRMIVIALLLIGAGSAGVDGFAVQNLTRLKFDVTKALGAGYISRVDSARLTIGCLSCAGAPAIDVLLGRQTDGTEERVRAGTTTIAQLDSMCRARSASCRVQGLRVAPAVGWISSYRFGQQCANTAVILRGGDLLTIRSVATDSATARRHAEQLIEKLVPLVVGR
jgi:hypothetical protein